MSAIILRMFDQFRCNINTDTKQKITNEKLNFKAGFCGILLIKKCSTPTHESPSSDLILIVNKLLKI